VLSCNGGGSACRTLRDTFGMADDGWTHHQTIAETVVLVAYPVLTVILIYFFINHWLQHLQRWGVLSEDIEESGREESETKDAEATVPLQSDPSTPTEKLLPEDAHLSEVTPRYGTVNAGTRHLMPGEVASDYSEPWQETADLWWVLLWVTFMSLMLILTAAMQPDLYNFSKHADFWMMMVYEYLAFMIVNLLGGITARQFCEVNEKGYVITNKDSCFKINYTRKLQHFFSMFVPLLIAVHNQLNTLEFAWNNAVMLTYHTVCYRPSSARNAAVFNTPTLAVNCS
jgi:hypothetical protein